MKYRISIAILDGVFTLAGILAALCTVAGALWAAWAAPAPAQWIAGGGAAITFLCVLGGRFTRDRVDPGGAAPRDSFTG